MFALAAERKVPILIHGGRGLPPIADNLGRLTDALSRRAADHRPRGHRRPGRARGAFCGQGRRLLRHLGVEPGRPPRLLPPGLARAGSLRLRLSVRAAARLVAPRAADGEARRPRREPAARDARRQRKPDRRRRAAARADSADRSAAPSPSRWRSRGSTSTCRWRRRSCGRGSRTRSA